jgi:hypothetical protein
VKTQQIFVDFFGVQFFCQDTHWEKVENYAGHFGKSNAHKIRHLVFQNALQILLLFKVASRYTTIYWRFLCTLGMAYLWQGQTPPSGLLGLFQTNLVAKFSMI